MRKKISLLLCAVAVMLCFTACKSSEEAAEYNTAAIDQTTEFMINYCANADAAMLEQWRSMREFTMELQLTQAGIPVTPESFLGALDAWEAAIDECGAYVSHGDFTSEETNEGLKVSASAQFEDRDATISFVFDDKSYMESMTVDAEYSMGEILEKAGLNTVLGMGTVFTVLIFISFLISLFKFIPALLGAKKKEEPSVAPVQSAAAQTSAPAVSEAAKEDDTELIAVIAAAIAAAREEAGMDEAAAGGFYVRSIRRRPSNKWNS